MHTNAVNLLNRPLRENLEILMPAWNNRTRGDHGIIILNIVFDFEIFVQSLLGLQKMFINCTI